MIPTRASRFPELADAICVVSPRAEERGCLGSVIEDLGHAVVGFQSAEDLLAALGDAVPACVIAAVDLPGLSGLNLLGRLAARPCAPPTILIGTPGNVRAAVEALRRGAHDYFDKPVRRKALRQSVSAILGMNPAKYDGPTETLREPTRP